MGITQVTRPHPAYAHGWDDSNRVAGLLSDLGLVRTSNVDPWGYWETDLLRCDFWAWDDASNAPAVIGTRHTGGTTDQGQVFGVTGYEMVHGRTSISEHASPASCTFTVVGHLRVDDLDEAAPPIEVGQGVRVYIPQDPATVANGRNQAASFLVGTGYPDPEQDARVARFVGQVTDLGDITVDARTQTVSMPVTCSGVLARLANTTASIDYTGAPGTARPADDRSMVIDVLGQVWNQDNGVRLGGWAADQYRWNDGVTLGAANFQLDAWTDKASAADLLTQLMDTVGGELMERRNGTMRWLTPATRKSLPVSLDLDVDKVLAPIVFGQHIADVVNAVQVGYGNNNTVTVTDQRSVRRRGKLSASIQTHLASAADARARGQDMAWRRGKPAWSVPTVTVDLTELLRRVMEAAKANAAHGVYLPLGSYPEWNLFKSLIVLDVGEPVRLNSMPDTSPIRAGGFFCDGITERFTPGRWLLDLTLIPAGQLAFPQSYDDLASYDGTWDAMDPDMSWEQATAWSPDPFPYGTWDGQPGNLWWTSVRYKNPATTYDDWTGK